MCTLEEVNLIGGVFENDSHTRRSAKLTPAVVYITIQQHESCKLTQISTRNKIKFYIQNKVALKFKNECSFKCLWKRKCGAVKWCVKRRKKERKNCCFSSSGLREIFVIVSLGNKSEHFCLGSKNNFVIYILHFCEWISSLVQS